MKKTNFSVKRLFDNDKFVLFFSLIAAIIFWVIITVIETPNAENTISGLSISVPIENTIAEDLNLQVMDDISDYRAEVTVRGPSYVVSSLSAEDFTVTASPADSNRYFDGAGTYNIKLRAKKQTGVADGEFEIISISPQNITLTFDRYVEVPIKLDEDIECPKISAAGGLIRGKVAVEGEKTLYFKGAKTEIDKIARVTARVNDEETISGTKSYDASIVIYDKNNNILPNENYNITGSTDNSITGVRVKVAVNRSKTVDIKPVYDNAPNRINGKKIGFKLDYTKAVIEGPVEVVDAISALELEPVDFTEVNYNGKVFKRKLANLPDDVEIADNIDEVTVTVTGLEGCKSEGFTVSNIALNQNSNYKVTLVKSATVRMFGHYSDINKINAKDLYAEIDVANISNAVTSAFRVPVIVKCKTSDEVWQIGECEAVINVE